MFLTKCPVFFSCSVMLPLETLPRGDTFGGVVYLWIVFSLEESSRIMSVA
jgi:hypothetical protein